MSELQIIQSCDNCGACCRHMDTPPHIVFYVDGNWQLAGESEESQEDYRLIASAPDEAKRLIEESWNAERPDGSPCAWLDEAGRCKFYEHRPLICRDFEVGSEDCLSTRQHYGIV